MTHDPLCTTVLNTEMNEVFCNCDWIARVREDERASILTLSDRVKDSQYAAGLRDAVEAVRARKGQYNEQRPNTHAAFREAMAAIEALGGER